MHDIAQGLQLGAVVVGGIAQHGHVATDGGRGASAFFAERGLGLAADFQVVVMPGGRAGRLRVEHGFVVVEISGRRRQAACHVAVAQDAAQFDLGLVVEIVLGHASDDTVALVVPGQGRQGGKAG